MGMIKRIILSIWIIAFLSGIGLLGAMAGGAPRMTIQELRRTMDGTDIFIIDVRLASHWDADTRKIKGALRGDPKVFENWATVFPRGKTLVLYCD